MASGVLEGQGVGGVGRQVAAVVEVKVWRRLLGVGGKVYGGGTGGVLQRLLLHLIGGGNLLLDVVLHLVHLVDVLLHLLVLHRGGVKGRNGLRGVTLLQGGARVGVGKGVGTGAGRDLGLWRLLGLLVGGL